MLKVESIRDGVVIDHITAGRGMELYRLLHLEGQQQPVALLQYVRSEKYGRKDLIKIEGLQQPGRLDILGYLDPQITLIVIREGQVVKKYRPTPPKVLKNVVRCRNPRCITSQEPDCEQIFRLSPGGKYRCIYCNQEISVKNSADFVL